MRFVLLVLLFASNAFAQAEIARQKFEQGLINARQERFEQALTDFQNALEKHKFASDSSDGFAAKINYNIGVCLYRSGHAEESISYLETAIRLAKNKYQQAFHALGIVQSELGNWQAAKTALVSALRLNKRDGESWFDLAMIRLRENDLPNAADNFQKAFRYQSVDAATAFNNLGVIAAINGDWAEAEKRFEMALAVSGGKLPEAARNLNLCRSENVGGDLIAKLEFALK